jgi:hypothetical protein
MSLKPEKETTTLLIEDLGDLALSLEVGLGDTEGRRVVISGIGWESWELEKWEKRATFLGEVFFPFLEGGDTSSVGLRLEEFLES